MLCLIGSSKSEARVGWVLHFSRSALQQSLSPCRCAAWSALWFDRKQTSAKKLIFYKILSWLVLLCCCVIARFEARERKGKWPEGWEATGFAAGLPLAWGGMRNCTLIVHVPAYVVIVINSSGIYFIGQSWWCLGLGGVLMYCKIYFSVYHVWYYNDFFFFQKLVKL